MTSLTHKAGLAVMAVGSLTGVLGLGAANAVDPATSTTTAPVVATATPSVEAVPVTAEWSMTGQKFAQLPKELGTIDIKWTVDATKPELTIIGLNGASVDKVDIKDATGQAIPYTTKSANGMNATGLMLIVDTARSGDVLTVTGTGVGSALSTTDHMTGFVVRTVAGDLPALSAMVGSPADTSLVAPQFGAWTSEASPTGNKIVANAPTDLTETPAPTPDTTPAADPTTDPSTTSSCDPNSLEGGFDCPTTEPTPEPTPSADPTTDPVPTPDPTTEPTVDPTTDPEPTTNPTVDPAPTTNPTTKAPTKESTPAPTTTKNPTTTKTPTTTTKKPSTTTTKKPIPTVKTVEKKTTVTVTNPDGTTTTKTVVRRVPVSTSSTTSTTPVVPGQVNSGGELNEMLPLYTVMGIVVLAGTGVAATRRKK